jgi:hypothetical protein
VSRSLSLLVVLSLLATTAVQAQQTPSTDPTTPPSAQPTRSFELNTQIGGKASNQFSEQELLKSFVAWWQSEPNRQRKLVGVVSLAVGQQHRIGWVTGLVRQGFGQYAQRTPDLDKFINFLRKRYPEVNFQDPDVLNTLHISATKLTRTLGGLFTEPSGVALFALIDPELATRGRLIAMQSYLSRRGTWDPQGNVQIQGQINALQQVLGDGIKDPLGEEERLIAMQSLLKDQGVPIPNTSEGAKILINQMLGRAIDISNGHNLPIPVDGTQLDPSGLVDKALRSLDERITAAETAIAK